VEQPDTEYAKDLLNTHLPHYVVNGLVETFAYVREEVFAHVTNTVQVTGSKRHSLEFWCRQKHGSLLMILTNDRESGYFGANE
jgi:hypothetical protein